MTRIDGTAVGLAALVGTVVLLVGAGVSAALDSSLSRGSSWLYLAWALVGFTAAGVAAGRIRTDTPVLHGILGGLGAAGVVLVFWTLVRFRELPDGDVVVQTLPITALLAATGGAAGGLLADALRRRSQRQTTGFRLR